MAPGTEFANDFCAWIGPLQLGVVLVSFIIIDFDIDNKRIELFLKTLHQTNPC